MNKCICFFTMLIFVLTAVFFSGCSGITYNPPGGSSGQRPGISTGIYPNTPSNPSDIDLPPLPEYEGFDESALYDYLYGIKVAYDSSAYYSQTAESSYIAIMLDNLEVMFENGYASFSAENYMATYPSEDYNQTDVTRAVWIYNLIDQYKLLAKLILTDLYAVYGFGYTTDFMLKSVFYPTLSLGEKLPTVENTNIINFIETESLNALTFTNPNFNTGYDYADVENIIINLETQKLILGTEEFDISVPEQVTSRFSSWKLNQLSNEDIANMIVPAFSFDNPLYDVGQTGEGDLCSAHELYVSGTISDNQIIYTLSTEESNENLPAKEANNLLDDYLNRYSLFVAYKLFEISAGVSPGELFNGSPDQITMQSFLPLIPDYINDGGMLGFVEQFKVPAIGEFTFIENASEMLQLTIVGYEDDDIAILISNSVSAWLSQYILISQNIATIVDETTINSVKLFSQTPNVEWEDILKSKLFETKNENFKYDYENIVDIVFMVNPNLERPKYFSDIILAFLSKESTVNLTTYFRYVQGGEEKIFELFDYTKKSDPIILDDGTEIDLSNAFMGTIPTHGEEITAEYVDTTLLYVNNKTAPNANRFKNYELTISGFTNNLASNFKQSANKITNKDYYTYDTTKNAIFYNEVAEDCDFIELSLIASNENQKLNYSFLFTSFALLENE